MNGSIVRRVIVLSNTKSSVLCQNFYKEQKFYIFYITNNTVQTHTHMIRRNLLVGDEYLFRKKSVMKVYVILTFCKTNN